MNNRGTWALIVVFFAGLIGLWWADRARIPDRAARAAAEPRVLPALLTTRPDEVGRLEIVGGEKPIAFERRAEGRWQMVEPIDAAADPSMVETLALNLKLLQKVRDAGTLREDPKACGLDPPARTVRLFGTDRSSPLAELQVGSVSRDYRYVREPGATGVEVVESRAIAAVDLPASRWRDRQLVRMPSFQVATLAAAGPGRDLRIEREGERWRIASPIRALADESRVEGVVAEVVSLRVAGGDSGFVADGVTDLAPFGLDKPALSVTITPRKGPPQTIQIGKAAPPREDVKGQLYYARRDDQDDVVLVDGGLLKDFGRDPMAFRGRKVAAIDAARAVALRVVNDGVAVDVVRRRDGTWGRVAPLVDAADAAAVDGFLKRLDGLEAGEMFVPGSVADPQLDRPWAVVKVWLGAAEGGSETADAIPTRDASMKLELGRRDPIKKAIFARVEGDPTILALPSVFLDGVGFGPLAFRDRRVAAASPPEIGRIVVQAGARSITLVPRKRGADRMAWNLTEPVAAPADPESVGRLLLLLSNLRADTLVTDRPESDARYGLDKPAVTVTWTTHVEPQASPLRPLGGEATTLTVGGPAPRPAGARYARISTGPIVFTLAPEALAVFDSEWRDRLALEFPPGRVERVTIRWPSMTLVARPKAPSQVETSAAADWAFVGSPAGLDFDPNRVGPLVKALSRLVTFKYAQYDGPIAPETGLFPPRVTVEVGLAGGGKPREIRLGRVTPDGYLYGTAATGPSGPVFLLPLRGWEPWLKAPSATPAPAAPAPK